MSKTLPILIFSLFLYSCGDDEKKPSFDFSKTYTAKKIEYSPNIRVFVKSGEITDEKIKLDLIDKHLESNYSFNEYFLLEDTDIGDYEFASTIKFENDIALIEGKWRNRPLKCNYSLNGNYLKFSSLDTPIVVTLNYYNPPRPKLGLFYSSCLGDISTDSLSGFQSCKMAIEYHSYISNHRIEVPRTSYYSNSSTGYFTNALNPNVSENILGNDTIFLQQNTLIFE